MSFIKAVAAQRAIKAPEEIAEIEAACNITFEMQTFAMRHTRAGMIEREIAGAMHGHRAFPGGDLAFPIIFSIHGETLHNHHHGNVMQNGNIVVNDCGARIRRILCRRPHPDFPGQREIHRSPARAVSHRYQRSAKALDAIKPGVPHRDIHLLACRALASGLKEVGLMKGDVNEAVAQGAHAMFFQCGLGHMMGLDVHDMEDLGEQYVGYEGTQRSQQFGLCYLRMAKPLSAGHVITCEPGIYIIPELIDQWKAERKNEQFIDYQVLETYRDFGGIRVEDDVLVTEAGYRILGKRVPITVEEVEAACSR